MTRVLVVEDEESYSDALAYMLRKEGFDVSLAATGPDAIAEFERTGADIVLLDLMLPGMPGTEVCRRIRPGAGQRHVKAFLAQHVRQGVAVALFVLNDEHARHEASSVCT